ncbi:unnamed protein product, partial [marine sediment metagenome]
MKNSLLDNITNLLRKKPAQSGAQNKQKQSNPKSSTGGHSGNTAPSQRNGSSSSPGGKGLPNIQANIRRLREITKDALSALVTSNNPPLYFVRGGAIVRFRTDEHDHPMLENVNDAMLIGRLARVADFFIFGSQGERKNSDPPPKVAKD